MAPRTSTRPPSGGRTPSNPRPGGTTGSTNRNRNTPAPPPRPTPRPAPRTPTPPPPRAGSWNELLTGMPDRQNTRPHVGVESLAEMDRFAAANPGSPYQVYNDAAWEMGQARMQNPNADSMTPMASILDLLNATANLNGGGGGGGRGGGGGGGKAGVDPAVQAAYQNLWNNMQQPGPDLWAGVEANARQAYDPTAVNQRWDQTGGAVQAATAAGTQRLDSILQELLQRAAESRTGVNQAVQQGDVALQGLQNQQLAASQQMNQGLNQGLGAFGAGTIAPSGTQSLQNLFAAGRQNNQALGNSYEAMAADRPVVYGGLKSDIASGMTRDEAALQNAIAVQRANELRANSTALNQALAQTAMQRAQQEAARAEARDRLMIEMAQLGIQV